MSLLRTVASAGLRVVVLSCACAFAASEVDAQAPAAVALFPSAHSDSIDDRSAVALDNVVLAKLGQRTDLTIATRPALDLAATTFALGCTAESVECLNTVAREAGVQALMAASVEADGAATIIRLTYFDARTDQAPRSVVRRYTGERREQDAIDAAPDMLNELLRSPGAPVSALPAAQPGTSATSPPRHGAIVAPIALASLGVVATGFGVAFGVSARTNETKYRDADTGTMAEVDRARSYLDRAQDQARAANIAFGVGAAAIAAGVIWLAFGLSGPTDRSETAILAPVGPGQIGLAVNGPLGGRSW